MCNLNIVFKTNKKNRDIASFLMGVTSNSYSSNSDGDGIFCDNKLVKGFNKIDLLKLKSHITKSKIVITHQRKATSGFSERWVQPFVAKEFVLVHNGIVNDFLGKKGSDTWGFFIKFIKVFDKQSGTREEKIISAIKKLLDDREHLFYSILILDRKTDIAYYFKSDSSSIHFYLSKDLLFVTTNQSNEIFLNLIKGKFNEIEIEDYKIYSIGVNKDITIFPVGEINHQELELDLDEEGEKEISKKINEQSPLSIWAKSDYI